MKELTYKNGWSGGQYNFSTEEVLNQAIVIHNSENKFLSDAVITKVKKRHGVDHDHGHEYRWENADYICTLPGDEFERNSDLRDLLLRGFLVFLKDS